MDGGGPEGYMDEGDEIGRLLRQADEAPYSYETLHALVAALSAAVGLTQDIRDSAF